LAIEGPLKELGIHDVFQLLDLSRKSGVLRITSKLRRNRGTVYFDSGQIIYAEIENNPHPLGELLVRAGKITEAELHQARELQRLGDGRRLGEILVAMGAIGARDLEQQLRRQIEEVVFELLSWQEGYFSFTEGAVEELPAEGIARVPTEALLMEGARRIDEWSRIESRIPHLGVVPMLIPLDNGDGGVLDLLPLEWEVLAAIDGERSVQEIAALLGEPEFEVAKIVFGLAAARIVAVVDRSRIGIAGSGDPGELEASLGRAEELLARGDLEGAERVAGELARNFPHEGNCHLLLGKIVAERGRDGEAEESLRRALRLDPGLQEAHRILGDVLARQGRFTEAAESWQRWLEYAQQVPELSEGVDEVQEAVQAAQTLAQLLGRKRGR
jgi:tetratricopeptide (TPR) repeat protein